MASSLIVPLEAVVSLPTRLETMLVSELEECWVSIRVCQANAHPTGAIVHHEVERTGLGEWVCNIALCLLHVPRGDGEHY